MTVRKAGEASAADLHALARTMAGAMAGGGRLLERIGDVRQRTGG